MSKRHSTKYKIDRRMGENIWGRPKSPVNRREYGPGQHGQGRKGKLSDFGVQLRAKQKHKGYYGNITEKQIRKIYGQASRPRTCSACWSAVLMRWSTAQNLSPRCLLRASSSITATSWSTVPRSTSRLTAVSLAT